MNELLQCAIDHEQNGDYTQSAQYYNKAFSEYPNDKDVMYFFGAFLFAQQQYEQALELFVKCYSHEDQSFEIKQEVLKHIISAYYLPNIESYKKTYMDNVSMLSCYEHNFIHEFPKFEELRYYLIQANESEGYVYDNKEKVFLESIKYGSKNTDVPSNLKVNDVLLAVDKFDMETIKYIDSQTRDPLWINNSKTPIYLIWKDLIKREFFLQIQQYALLIEQKRVVIFSDFENDQDLESFLKNTQSILPNKFIADPKHAATINDLLVVISEYGIENKRKMLKEIKKMTQGYNDNYYRKLFSGDVKHIRILFYTSRFTQVVQYATRDLMKACQSLGIICEYLIEKNDIQRAGNDAFLESIIKFKPNILFRINFMRFDFDYLPKNILFISWIQDPCYLTHSSQAAKNFGKYDYVIGSKVYLDQMEDTGYQASRLSIQDVPVDDSIFIPRTLSFEEKQLFSSDIGLPSNYSNPEDALSGIILDFLKGASIACNEKNKEILTKICIRSYDVLQCKINNGELITNSQHCEIILREFCDLLGVNFENSLINGIAERLFLQVCLGLHRKATINWVLKSGFNIKLWGRNWDEDYFLRPYARGVIKHGEELSKVYSATKIILATFSHYTGHFRVFESLCCGSLPFLRYIPREVDMLNDFRENFIENEHFVFFYDEKDLIEKLHYYLNNEDERLKIVNSGRKRTMEVCTYSIAAKKLISFIQKDLKKSIKGVMKNGHR